jgi:uncharacterized membrane protein
MRILYLIFLAVAFTLMGAHAFLGREFFGNRRRADLPPSVRQTPGGYRTFLHNNGFHGGK